MTVHVSLWVANRIAILASAPIRATLPADLIS